MTDQPPEERKRADDDLMFQLQERAKELNCLYQIEEALSNVDEPAEVVGQKVVDAIPPGWQYPDVCVARLELEDETYTTANFRETEWKQTAEVTVSGVRVGELSVYYLREMPEWDDGPFLKEEARLIQTIADRIGHRVMHQRMRKIVSRWDRSAEDSDTAGPVRWRVILDLVRQTDPALYATVSRRMLNYLCWSGIEEAEALLQNYADNPRDLDQAMREDWNQPYRTDTIHPVVEFSEQVYAIAEKNISAEDILKLVQKWMQEDKLSFLVQVVNRNLSLAAVADAIRRYHHLAKKDADIQSPHKRGTEVSLIRRFLSDQLPYIRVAKDFVEVSDFYHLLQNVIFTTESHGKLGGKSAGMYLAAQILQKTAKTNPILGEIKVPKTCFVTSDVLLHFMHYNDFDEVVEQKYKPISQVRFEYPHIVQTFKNARFPADILKGLSVALDEFGDRPLIVRSSSLLEDRIGAAFSGKYKSLFLANRGSKKDRLSALADAIAEVYASTFGPDPIEYRAERDLLDFGEEMGIMIQEVVGNRVGKYFLPSYAGVAFSNNEFRWSPRIKRTDGLVRLVPGLGTRAVDRLSDDYPVLIAPGQPNLRVNASPDEKVRYSPHYINVINLETNAFETVKIGDFIRDVGQNIPGLNHLISVFDDGHLRVPTGMDLEPEKQEVAVTFEGLATRTSFVKQVKAILETLQETLDTPVDIEFASDGHDFYLLQCRPQSFGMESAPAPIPKKAPADRVLFTANKYVSNGRVPDITHIVYVDPQRYTEISERSELVEIGRVIGRLNKLLPKRQFILMGPGRWGSRGDIRLGVSVTYSDINNTAALIEIARKKGGYVPDLSFGTHFFQDLVEAGIRYLPLYPDEEKVQFNEAFFLRTHNILAEIAPEYEKLADTVRVIDVPKAADGQILSLLMNADLDEAMGLLAPPGRGGEVPEAAPEMERPTDDYYWRWRMRMVESLARRLDGKELGVVAMYVFGSTKNATAGPGSDIDVLVHFRGEDQQKCRLLSWLEGWSQSLGELNYQQTGYKSEGLLDVHLITDKDIERKSSWAAKIDAVTDAARPVQLKSHV